MQHNLLRQYIQNLLREWEDATPENLLMTKKNKSALVPQDAADKILKYFIKLKLLKPKKRS